MNALPHGYDNAGERKTGTFCFYKEGRGRFGLNAIRIV